MRKCKHPNPPRRQIEAAAALNDSTPAAYLLTAVLLVYHVYVPIPTYYSRRPGGAKPSLSSREGLPNLAFEHFASTLPLFAASLA